MEEKTNQIFTGIISGDRAALSKGITLAESTRSDHQAEARLLLDECSKQPNKSIRIGITGVPGVGKSTFIEAFGTHLTSLGLKIAVLAVDPSSQISKGSILGDKTRMEGLSRNANAFIRPSPTRLELGGVNSSTRSSIILSEAAGFDVIIVETVGVGQSETEVAEMVDFFLLLMLSGAGDELQGIKRGIMEIAHGLFINKCDQNMKAAKQARAEYRSALQLIPPHTHGWETKVIAGSSTTGEGVEEVWQLIETFKNDLGSRVYEHRLAQNVAWMNDSLGKAILRELSKLHQKDPTLLIQQQVASGEMTPFAGLHECVQLLMSAYKG